MEFVGIFSMDSPVTVQLGSQAAAVNLTSMNVLRNLVRTLALAWMASIHLPASVQMLGTVLRVRIMFSRDCVMLSHRVPMAEGAQTQWIHTSVTVLGIILEKTAQFRLIIVSKIRAR